MAGGYELLNQGRSADWTLVLRKRKTPRIFSAAFFIPTTESLVTAIYTLGIKVQRAAH